MGGGRRPGRRSAEQVTRAAGDALEPPRPGGLCRLTLDDLARRPYLVLIRANSDGAGDGARGPGQGAVVSLPQSRLLVG